MNQHTADEVAEPGTMGARLPEAIQLLNPGIHP